MLSLLLLLLTWIYFQLSEISIDLAEEHTTSNKATELLDSETVGRMQLERELKELTVSTS